MVDAAVSVRRPRNAEATRAAIMEAARARFTRDGYEQVGVRDIAADAGIDPALVNRYFGSKEGLFVAVLNSMTKEPLALRVSSGAGAGEQLARIVLRLGGEGHKDQLDALDLAIRSTNSPTASEIVREDLERRFILPMLERFGGGPGAAARVNLCTAIVMGTGVMRGILGESGPSQQVREQMITHLAPIFDALLNPPKTDAG